MTDTTQGRDRGLSPRWMWSVTGLIAVLVLGGAAAVVAVDANVNDRGAVRDVAKQYIAAVAEGDAEAAELHFAGASSLGEEGESMPGGGATTKFTADALASASRIEDAEFRSLDIDFEGGRAAGEVSYELNGERYWEELKLRQDANEQWKVVSGLRYAVPLVESANGGLGLRGMDGPFPDESTSIVLYTGAYTFVSHNELFRTVDDAEFVLTTPYDSIIASDWLLPGPGFAEAVQDQIARSFSSCAEERLVAELWECGIDAPPPSDRFATSAVVAADVEMIRAPEAYLDEYSPTWAPLDELGEFVITYTGKDSTGKKVQEVQRATARAGDIAIRATDDGIEVEITNY
ncbi:nuclear transport factor 2 family protein [Leucobacter sp. USHLN153]|uniref:nuclear transport factor 2 family protein n=1 Tax=Leucobacter sp. USHLN153 TaxID=3081268 RepID=UPI003017BE2E